MWRLRRDANATMSSIVGCALLLVVQRSVWEPFGGILTTLIYLGMVLIAGVLGGWRTGVVATALGLFVALFFFSPPYIWRLYAYPTDLYRLLAFLLIGLVLSSICEMLKLAWKRTEIRQQQLEEEVKERRKAQIEEKMRADELMTTLSSIGDGVIKTDHEGRVTFLNPVAEKLVGWTCESASGHLLSEVFQIVNETTRLPVINPAVTALKEGHVVGLANHTILISRDGIERPIDDSASPIRDATGTVIGCVLVFRDVTEKKRVEAEREQLLKEVQAAKARMDEIFHRAPAFICLLHGPDHVCEMANERFMDLIGHRSLLGKTAREALPELAHQGYFDRLDAVYQTGQAFVGNDMQIFLQQGDTPELVERYGDFVFLPIRDSEGKISGILVHGVDQTDRKAAARKVARVVAESEQQRRMFDTALTNIPNFVYLFDLCGRFTYVNKPLLDLWKRSLEEAVNRNFHDLGYPTELADRLHHQIQEVIQTRQFVRDEMQYTSDIGTRSYEHIFVPVFGANGEVEAVAGSSHDVTDRKLAEVALQAADKKKDDFIALLAHELRNPLAPIRNGLQVIRLSDDQEMVVRAREMMDRQLSHMVRLIDDLLDVSRIGRNKMQLRRERVSVADIFANAVETSRPIIEEAGHELSVSLPAVPMYLNADLTRLSQVLSNLLTNSAKYTERGGHVWLAAAAANSDVVRITVRDDGIGIPADSLPRIFDMFSQVDRPMERSSGGLGIGLALVKGLVEMHGGSVLAQSEGPGKGSLFTITLPLLQEKPEAQPAPADETKHQTSGKRRVLVVDDSRDGAETLAMMLKLQGNEVATAHDGLEAVEKAAEFRPSLILMDVGMPRLNGWDATRRIREMPWGRSITIIALTGWGQDNDREQSSEAGCNGHLVKPVSWDELGKLLNDCAPGQSAV
jgi:PAS domain S-box-containing protein